MEMRLVMKLFDPKWGIFITLIFLTGCWNHRELPQYGFVQSIAVDIGEEGKTVLTTQFYRPSPKIASQGSESDAMVNIQTEGDTIFESIRKITTKLGRRAQWSHMRIIVVSEDYIKKNHLGEVFDYFSRDHEPRLLTRIAVVKGKASDLLDVDPYFENTISQQLNEMLQATLGNVGSTLDSNLLSVGKQMNSQTEIALLSNLKLDDPKHIQTNGSTVIQNGRYVRDLNPDQTMMLLVLTNEFSKGVLNIPCGDNKEEVEVIEIIRAKTNSKPKVKDGSLQIEMKIKVEGIIGELMCTTIKTSEELDKYNKKVKDIITNNAKQFIEFSKEEKLDLMGVGQSIYQKNPKQWKKIKGDWKEIYSEAEIKLETSVNILNTGDAAGVPFQQDVNR